MADCEDLVCKQQSLYNKYKRYISIDENNQENEHTVRRTPHCPIGKDVLGLYTWNYLHTMAAYYPKIPTDNEKSLMKNFIESFAYFFPCKVCAMDFQKDVKENPIKLNSNEEFTVWLCERHNKVNLKLGKNSFDCNYENLVRRWKTGDKSCGSPKNHL